MGTSSSSPTAICGARDRTRRLRSFGLPVHMEHRALERLLIAFKADLPSDLDRMSLAEVCDILDLPMPAPRPRLASGTFLRLITVNDIYRLHYYPELASAIRCTKALAEGIDYACLAFHNGDFVSPCVLTALDGGQAMTQVLDRVGFDFACLGNHEFDLSFEQIGSRINELSTCQIVNSNVTTPPLEKLPKSKLVEVGSRKVLIGGFLGDDKSIYPPKKRPEIKPCLDSMIAVWDDAKMKNGGIEPDLFLPMTHQVIAVDREMAAALAKRRPDIAARTPVFLAGHDHELFIDEAGKSTVVKVGQNGERIGFIDIYWDAESSLHCSVSVMPSTEFPPLQSVKDYCDTKEQFVASMMSAPLLELPRSLSSVRVRFEPSDMATFLLSLLKRALRHEDVELAMVQGGGVRAGREYAAGPFTMADLYAEFAFPMEMAVIPLPGSIIAESIKASRISPKPAPNFLHVDDAAEVNDANELTAIDGQPLKGDKVYTIAVPLSLLTGMNAIEPLFGYVTANVKVPPEDSCTRAKEAIIDYCMKEMWRRLLGQDTLEGAGSPSSNELVTGLNKAFESLDTNSDGRIKRDELADAMAQKFGKRPGASLIKNMIDALDLDKDGDISKEELFMLAH